MSYSTYKNLGNQGAENDANKEIVDRLVPRLKSVTEKMHIISTNKIVVIDVYADWCQPCKQIAPQVAELSRKYTFPSMCMIVKENLDDKISDNDDIAGVPTFRFYINGKNVDSVVGADIPEVERKLVAFLKGFSR